MNKKTKKLIRSMERQLEHQRVTLNFLAKELNQLQRRLYYVRPYTEQVASTWQHIGRTRSQKESE